MKKVLALVAALACTVTVYAQTSITGAGATFPAPIYSKWADGYKKATGNNLNYQGIGSSGGIKQINTKTVDFGASDDPVSQKDLAQNGQYQFPTVIGGLVIIFNIKGIESEKITLDGKTLADIYEGKITKWNDAAIVKLNPEVKLPDLVITVITRSDGSGTTAVFTDYLTMVSSSFKESTGSGKTVNWKPANMVGGRGNAGVAAMVTKVEGGIGYVEYAFAKQAKIPYTIMLNRKGEKIRADDDTFAKSAAGGNWDVPGMAANLNNLDGWPMTATTFVIIYEKDPGNNRAVVDFWRWVYANGDKDATTLDYVPLPKSVKDRILADFKRLGF
jgi:phosphate transport system substrate-binding protein